MNRPSRPEPSLRGGLLILLTLSCAVTVGCQAAGPKADEPFEVSHDSSAELVMQISDQPFVTAEAAYRAVYALRHGASFTGTFDELTAVMREERLIGTGWKYPPELYLRRGTVGFMICRACDIRTGLNWTLTGLGRYAWRELQYRRIAQISSELGLISGGEFVGILTRAEDYARETGKRGLSPVELEKPEG